MNFMPNPSADWHQYKSFIGDENKQKLKNGLMLAASPYISNMMGIKPPGSSNPTSSSLPSLGQANPSPDYSFGNPQAMSQTGGLSPDLGGATPLGVGADALGADALGADAAGGAIDALFML